jgi:hypothetical protein
MDIVPGRSRKPGFRCNALSAGNVIPGFPAAEANQLNCLLVNKNGFSSVASFLRVKPGPPDQQESSQTPPIPFVLWVRVEGEARRVVHH